jgi:threonyl-tRNA synthetase
MPIITLPDGSQRTYPQPVSIAELAADIGPGLAKAAVAGRVDGRGGAQLVDTAFILEQDATVSLITARDPEGLEILRHSCAHLMAMAVKQLYPEAQVTIGPTIEDGFYYDFAYSRPFTPEDLRRSKRMRELARADLPLERSEVPRDEAVRLFDRWAKLQVRDHPRPAGRRRRLALPPGRLRRPLPRPARAVTGKLKAFKLMKVAGAYWRGDSKNAMLQRIYGTCWADEKEPQGLPHPAGGSRRSAITASSARSSTSSTSTNARPVRCSGTARAGRCSSS